MLMKVHQGAIERLVDLIWMERHHRLTFITEVDGETYRNNPTASQTRAQAGV